MGYSGLYSAISEYLLLITCFRIHLSSKLFFFYLFCKLVEEEEGNLALWVTYILTVAGANLVLWLLHLRNSISVGAFSAVFGLFSISVLVKMSWDWRKILEFSRE